MLAEDYRAIETCGVAEWEGQQLHMLGWHYRQEH